MLNSSGEKGHPCLGLDHRGKVFSLSPLSMILAAEFSYMPFITLRKFPSIPSFLSGFYHESALDFFHTIFLHRDDHVFLSAPVFC